MADAPDTPPPAAPPAGEPQPPAAPALSPAERRARAVADALRTLARDLHVSRFGHIVQGEESLGLQLRFTVSPARNWDLRFDPPLVDQLTEGLQDARADRGAFRRGRAYCFRCGTALCEHAAPPACPSVFAGYGPTGLPEWQDFAQVLIERRDERVDRLFDEHPPTLAVLQLGHDLRLRQLSSFGRASKTYALLGQVVAGYFPARPPDARAAPERVALSFQAVEVRDAAGAPRVTLNVLGRHPQEPDLAEALASGWEPSVFRAREIALRDLEAAGRQAAAAREAGRAAEALQAMRRVPGILRRLAESLERGGRQLMRRTRHAEERRTERRPVHKAVEDALSAPPGRVFHDTRTGGFVACGEQGRAHVFSAEGRHVTSFVLKPGSVEFRARTGRWRPAAPAEAEALRTLIRDRAPPGDAAGPAEPAP